MIFRRRADGDVWHWLTACAMMPKSFDDMVEFKGSGSQRPLNGKLCENCKIIARGISSERRG